jgi:hypothetical protein
MSISNSTVTPKDSSLIDFVIRAVKKHFSDVLDIESLKEGEGITIGRRTVVSDYVCIRLKNNTDPKAFLKINAIFIEYPDLGGAVEAGQGPNPFNTYGELKKAIRDGVMQIREKQWVDNNSNIANNYRMS